jgi:hypothetical protein
METISGISRIPEFGKSIEERRLIIFSDMLQNVKNYTQYTNRPVVFATSDDVSMASVNKEDRKKIVAYFKTMHCDLKGIKVQIYYQNRLGKQPPGHQEFWEAYFRDCGATDFTWKTPGMVQFQK